MRRRLLANTRVLASLVAVAVAAAAVAAAPASSGRAVARAEVAGVQVALRAAGRYQGPVDGIPGPLTRQAIRSLQRSRGVQPTGQVNSKTLSLLGPLGRHAPGSRVLRRGTLGLDVSVLQFELRARRYHVIESGLFDAATARALVRFQRAAGLHADALAGHATWAALARSPSAIPVATSTPRLRPPLAVPSQPRVVRAGVELFCAYASAVAAAAAGTVVYAGDRGRGYGYTVITRDGAGLQLLYAHLARIDVRRSQRVIAGAMIGLAGWTGKTNAATSLLLELTVDGRRLHPLRALRLGTRSH
jgi:murein DD-endopeptidase MepM/ murein hydrolase activator NlpD